MGLEGRWLRLQEPDTGPCNERIHIQLQIAESSFWSL
jgi:hypothetical protein